MSPKILVTKPSAQKIKVSLFEASVWPCRIICHTWVVSPLSAQEHWSISSPALMTSQAGFSFCSTNKIPGRKTSPFWYHLHTLKAGLSSTVNRLLKLCMCNCGAKHLIHQARKKKRFFYSFPNIISSYILLPAMRPKHASSRSPRQLSGPTLSQPPSSPLQVCKEIGKTITKTLHIYPKEERPHIYGKPIFIYKLLKLKPSTNWYLVPYL